MREGGCQVFFIYLGVIDFSSRPLHRVIIVFLVATGPHADADVHGCLRVTLPSVGVFVLDGPHDVSVYVPFQAFVRPASRVVVKTSLGGIGHGVPFRAGGFVGGVAFAVVVVFGVGGVGSDEFEVDFVEVVGLEDDG